jgi:hypothetical protein
MKCVDLIFDMKYVVLFKRQDRIPNMDQWFDTEEDAEKRREELQEMFNWLYERNDKVEGNCIVWVEEKK